MKRAASVSIRMVAERAGVSMATVSNVLTGKPTVSQAYAERVRAAATALGYVADSHASRLRSGRDSLAGVVVPDLGHPMYSAFVSTLERLARADGFDLIVVSSDNDPDQEAQRLRAIRSWRLAGLIVIPTDGALAARVPIGQQGPIVVADRIPDDPAFDLIAVDNARSAGVVARHLADQGYRRCIVAAGSLGFGNVQERWEGAAAGAGPMALTKLECGLEPVQSHRRIASLLAETPAHDAFFALDGRTSLIAYRAVGNAGLVIPTAMAFASFDEAEWMTLVSPPITAVRQPVQRMAEAAWARLLARLDRGSDEPHHLRLACVVDLRASTLRRTQ